MSSRRRLSSRLWVERLEDRLAPAVFSIADGDEAGLITAILISNVTAEADTIQLAANGLYEFGGADNFWYGPNALPAISSAITIEGNGATLDRLSTGTATTDALRFFYISGGLSGLSAGSLTLKNLTLQDGLAKGGDSDFGGGGMGAGGAIFSQGTLSMDGVTLTGNTAQGGHSGVGSAENGGGIGQDASGANGGGFGGAFPLGTGGGGGAPANSGGGGGGFVVGGGNGSTSAGGAGGGFSQLGGRGGSTSGGAGGDGGGGGGAGFAGGAGGAIATGGGISQTQSGSGGGGGVGGGGGYGSNAGGGGGFGGGGGSSAVSGGFGGFGGGGGGTLTFGVGGGGGFGGGSGGSANPGGGGGGMGGALFVHLGSAMLINCTLAGNLAAGGNGASGGSGGGSGFGGGILNLNGTLTLRNSTLAGNTVTAGTGTTNGAADGGAVYSLAFGNGIFAANTSVSATVILINSILADSTGGNDLVNHRHGGATAGSQAFLNLSTVKSIVESFVNDGGTIVNAGPGNANIVTVDPGLDPAGLQDNGGLTETNALLAGSPAIDAGNALITLGVDQRGFARDALPDLGAYEFVGGLLAAGADSTHAPEVKVYANGGTLRFSLLAYPETFLGGVRVAVGDVTGDGVADFITAPGKGLAKATVKVFDGNTGLQVAAFTPFASKFKGGAYVAAGNFDGDAGEEVVVGMGSAGGQVRVFNIDGGVASQGAGPLGKFNPYGARYKGGVTVAAGNFDGAGSDEVITGKAKGPAQVRVFGDISGARVRQANFLAYASPFAGGVFVAAGDLNGDGAAEIITGPGAGTTADVKTFNGIDGTPGTPNFTAYPAFTGGVRVAVLDLDGDGEVDRIVAAPGKGQALEVKLFDLTPSEVDTFFAFEPGFTGGVFVGG